MMLTLQELLDHYDNLWEYLLLQHQMLFQDILQSLVLMYFSLNPIHSLQDTGVFTGDFQIPSHYCKRSGLTTGVSTSVTGVDIEVNYVDFRDASGEIIEVGDGAGVRANTGSVTLDRTVYPVPFGVKGNFADSLNTSNLPNGRSIFPVHETGTTSSGLTSGQWLANGDLTIHVRVNDPDFDLSASGEDKIASNATAGVGPVKVSVIRGSSTVVLGHAGGPDVLSGTINTGTGNINGTRQFGPMTEVSPDSGIFEIDIGIRYTDGPASTLCPTTSSFTALDAAGFDSGFHWLVSMSSAGIQLVNLMFHSVLNGENNYALAA
jgi:hypothetical protein